MSVSAGRVHSEAVTFTRCGQTCGRKRSSGLAPASPTTGSGERGERDNPVDNDSDLATAWQRVVEELQPNQQAWVRASEPVTLHGNTAIIAVADDFTRTQLEGRLRGQLEDALTAIFGREIRLAVTVNAQLGEGSHRGQTPEATSPSTDMSTDRHVPSPSVSSPEPTRPATGETRLNPKYTFETFVIGSSNRFPHAAAVAVA
jgi:chromosomal replication initiator protein